MKKKKLFFCLIVGIFVCISIFFVFKSLTKESEKSQKKIADNSTVVNISPTEISKETDQLLREIAFSKNSEKANKDLELFITKLEKGKQQQNTSEKEYIEILCENLAALESYYKGTSDEKALGKSFSQLLEKQQILIDTDEHKSFIKNSQDLWFLAASRNYQEGRKRTDEIVLSFVGDNSFGTYPETPENLKFDTVFTEEKGTNTYVYQNCLPWFYSDDYTVINAESAFTNATKAVEKEWQIKSNPEHVAFLPASGVEAANLANNHTLDYYEEGYQDTLTAFENNNIAIFNDGIPLVTKISDVEFVFLGYDIRYDQYTQEFHDKIINELKKYKKPDNFVVVNLHWGIEYMEGPAAYQPPLAHDILDAGGDIIMGSHPHRLQSIEEYNGKYIVYSMGDFAFGADPTLLSRMTAIFQLRVEKNSEGARLKSLEFVPAFENSNGSTNENNYQPKPVYGNEAKEIIEELTKISQLIPGGLTEFTYFDPF